MAVNESTISVCQNQCSFLYATFPSWGYSMPTTKQKEFCLWLGFLIPEEYNFSCSFNEINFCITHFIIIIIWLVLFLTGNIKIQVNIYKKKSCSNCTIGIRSVYFSRMIAPPDLSSLFNDCQWPSWHFTCKTSVISVVCMIQYIPF